MAGREANGAEERNLVTFCVIDCPFICEVHGKFTTDALKEIEEQFVEEPPDDLEYNVATVTYRCNFFTGQYDGFGRCEIAPYWEIMEVSRTVFE